MNAGIDRKKVEEPDGCTALILWEQNRNTGNEKALESLLAHNTYDAVSLESLMVTAYNLKLEQTPFRESNLLTLPTLPKIPYEGDPDTITDAYETSLTDDRFPWRIYELYRS